MDHGKNQCHVERKLHESPYSEVLEMVKGWTATFPKDDSTLILPCTEYAPVTN
jgi:hypothetical protein